MAEYSSIPVDIVADKRSYVMKIDGYSRTKELLKTGKHATSARFRVGGNYWVMEYYPNGYETADFVSVCLRLVYSDVKDVKAEFRFSILDKDGDPVDSLSRTTTIRAFSSKSSYWGYVIKKRDLEQSGHLRDDCFSIRCDVSVLKASEEISANQFVVILPSDLDRHLSDLLKSKDGTDVTFQVGGESFSAHRFVLAARSSVFRAELFGVMKENPDRPIKIHDMEADVFKSLLRFIYTHSLLVVPSDGSNEGEEPEDVVMAGHLLVAADRYNIERLKLICECKLCNHIDPHTVATSLALAEQHSCHGLKEACLQFLASPSILEGMKANDGYKHLKSRCPSVLKELVARLLPAELKAAKDIIMEI